MLYSYACFKVKVMQEQGVVKRITILGEAREVLPALPRSMKLDLSGFTPFERAVMEKAREIPPGKVATYATLAKAAGYPGAARAVGNVMAKNPFPIIVPCHRVVRSDLRVGGYAYGGEVKRRLLRAEGVDFAGERVKSTCVWDPLTKTYISSVRQRVYGD
jgi:O-6-methylguanine DNA methyltransferase